VTLIGGVLRAAACVERVSAPGDCPAFCPSGQIEIVDTVLTSIISRDSTFRGYVTALSAPLLLAADLPGFVAGRAIFRINGFGQRFILSTADTGAILGADSARLQLTVARRDTGAHNLSLAFYRLPITVDSTTTFAGLAGPFTDSLVKRVNIDTLLARPGHKDTLTGDSVVVDTVNNVLVLALKFDTAAARYVGTDSGTVAYGVRVSADSLASIAITRSTLSWQWYLRVDSIGTPVARKPGSLGAAFSSFVFDPPPPPPDSTLAVGGVPSARSFLRVAFPHFIRDSSQIIRGTLTLVPAARAARQAGGGVLLADPVLSLGGPSLPAGAAHHVRATLPLRGAMNRPDGRTGGRAVATAVLAAVFLTANPPDRLTAQDSQFGIRGLGTPGRWESVRPRSTGRAFGPFDPLSPLTDAGPAAVPQLTATAMQTAPSRDAVVAGTPS